MEEGMVRHRLRGISRKRQESTVHPYRIDTRAVKRSTTDRRPGAFSPRALNHFTVGDFLYELFRALPECLVLFILSFLPKSSICDALAAGVDSRRPLFVAEICRRALCVFDVDREGLPREAPETLRQCRHRCECKHGLRPSFWRLDEQPLDISRNGIADWLLKRRWSYVEECFRLARFQDQTDADLCRLYWDSAPIFDTEKAAGHQTQQCSSKLAGDPVFLTRFALCLIKKPINDSLRLGLEHARRLLRGRPHESLVIEDDNARERRRLVDSGFPAILTIPRFVLKLPESDPLREDWRWKVPLAYRVVTQYQGLSEGPLDLGNVCGPR